MDTNLLFTDFSAKLLRRGHLLTEDSIRYLFFSSMLAQDGDFNHYILELPYHEIENPSSYPVFINNGTKLRRDKKNNLSQLLDLYYTDKEVVICTEFKFHRKGKICTSRDRTSSAGKLFNDLRRLNEILPCIGVDLKRYLVYVTDDEMHNYFSGSIKSNTSYVKMLNEFYYANLEFPKSANQIIVPASFWKSANSSFNKNKSSTHKDLSFEIAIRKVFDLDAPSNCTSVSGSYHIKIYEIVDSKTKAKIAPEDKNNAQTKNARNKKGPHNRSSPLKEESNIVVPRAIEHNYENAKEQ